MIRALKMLLIHWKHNCFSTKCQINVLATSEIDKSKTHIDLALWHSANINAFPISVARKKTQLWKKYGINYFKSKSCVLHETCSEMIAFLIPLWLYKNKYKYDEKPEAFVLDLWSTTRWICDRQRGWTLVSTTEGICVGSVIDNVVGLLCRQPKFLFCWIFDRQHFPFLDGLLPPFIPRRGSQAHSYIPEARSLLSRYQFNTD